VRTGIRTSESHLLVAGAVTLQGASESYQISVTVWLSTKTGSMWMTIR
jgi:hypothetical protein